MNILAIIISILILDFIVERGLAWLNLNHGKNKIPEQLKEYFDEEYYEKSVRYEKAKAKIGILSSSISFVLMLLVLIFHGFGFLDHYIIQITQNEILRTLIFFGIIGILSDIIGIPLEYYITFVIEEKFGFNKMNLKTFILDKLKSYLIAILLGGGLLSLIVWIYTMIPDYFWLLAWGITTIITLFFSMFYSQIIVPLFNKQTPLEDGELRNAIEVFAKKTNFDLKNIFVMDGSKRSTKANAYFTGLGSKKRIVLFDTLINEHSVEELVAVLAHEIGHYKKKHILKSLIMGIAQTGILFFLLSQFINPTNPLAISCANALGTNVSLYIGVITFGLLFSPVSFVIGLFTNHFSRKNEYEADYFAATEYDGKHLSTALIKLSKQNLSKLDPHPWYIFVHYSHPTLIQRLKNLGF